MRISMTEGVPMTQKERLSYFISRINNDPELKDEVYDKCDPCEFFDPEELQEDLEFLLEGGCKQEHDLIPFMDDGCGGLYVLVNNEHVALIGSEGNAGYIADTVDDFVNILFVFKFFCYSETSLNSFEQYMKEYDEDSFSKERSDILDKFLEDENMDTDPKKVYEKLVKGICTMPELRIDPTDDDYVPYDNLLGMSSNAFTKFCKEHN